MLKKADLSEVKAIYRVINSPAKKGLLLPRSLNFVYEHIRDFWVYKEKSKVIGCCALHIIGWLDLAEIKSLAVDKNHRGRDIGTSLVAAALDEAAKLNIKKVFALTYAPKFFKKLGFKPISKAKLPHKIWADCIDCVHFPPCREEALIRDI